ncbi:MAG TPA: GrpB family protein [Streptosporangiaceae bacterium]
MSELRAAVPLLLRDYLRSHPPAAAEYRAVKRRLAARHPGARHAYADAKVPHFWDLIRRADEWARQAGWEPGPGDA